VSLADLIVLGGCAGGRGRPRRRRVFEVRCPSRRAAPTPSQEQTDVESFACSSPRPTASATTCAGRSLIAEELLVDKAQLLTLTAPEMTVLSAACACCQCRPAKHGVFTQRPGTLTNDFFVNLLDMGTAWKGRQAIRVRRAATATGAVKWTGTRADLVFGSNSQLRALAEVYARATRKEKFVNDFVAAWTKVMNLDRFDLSVSRIDTAARTVTTDDGVAIAYRDLVLALGADPIRPALAGDATDAVCAVNDLDDYARFADALEGAKSVAILGAGLIGCEFANDLLHRGITPTVLDVADRPLSRLLPAEASAWLRERLEAAGVSFRLGVAASRVDHVVGGGLRLTLSDGGALRADRVLSAIGLQPRTALAAAAGIAVARGITTDRLLATSAMHVYAVGDCSEVLGLNLPYVMPLMQQSRALAATLCGRPTPVAYPAMPVLVKTPACPTVVCPPPPGAAGEWHVVSSADACEARFVGAGGSLLGFALLGTATTKKQTWVVEVPAWFAD
jgi:rubredoxin---NAD+ reductase